MTAGLQTFDAAGRLLLDTSTYCGRFLGRVSFSASGSLVDARLTEGMPFYMTAPLTTQYDLLDVSFSGNTLIWNVGINYFGTTFTIFYGLYG
ncbi:hypothetical protein [Martelella mediterranea]|uniref:Uncharacterized protein n=1 Tax=Martelella mediterranea TaxID=293089 RepID=A0A4R3NIQ3_9HYPH|nr:hypothetical protein [Martelella mediterranea]TCT28157.1 hypothetical protein EDC90_10665 [Martelella mediterranea]